MTPQLLQLSPTEIVHVGNVESAERRDGAVYLALKGERMKRHWPAGIEADVVWRLLEALCVTD